METQAHSLDEKVLNDYQKNYLDGVTILRRSINTSPVSKKVNVYVDGILTTMPEDLLKRLIDSGFYVVVKKKP